MDISDDCARNGKIELSSLINCWALPSVEYHSLLMNEGELLSDICTQNHRSSGR